MPVPSQLKYVAGGFGLQGKAKIFANNIEEVELNNLLNTAADDLPLVSALGTPVFADVIFKLNEEDEGIRLVTVLVDVTQTKNIVKTPVQGLDGTIKEYISDGDFMINIKGAFVSDDGNYPIDKVNNLIFYLKGASALPVVSPFLQLFEIYNLVVTDYKFTQREGFQNTQLFEINAISDAHPDLIDETIL